MKPRNVFMPLRAFSMSVHAGSWFPFESVHIEPVRSSTSITSSGFWPHGEQAVADACTVKLGTPSSFANVVETVPVSFTTTAFAGAQPGADAMHRVETVIVTLSSPSGELLPPAP